MTDEIEKKADRSYLRWKREIEKEEKAHFTFRKEAARINSIYRDDAVRNESKYNILWPNVEVLRSAIFSSTPKPDIRRRFMDADPVAREVSEIMERGVSYTLDQQGLAFTDMVRPVLDDFLLAGLGTMRVRYQPYFEKGEPPKIYAEVRQEVVDYDLVTGSDVTEDTYLINGEVRDPDQIEIDEQGPFEYGEPEEELVYEEVVLEPIPWSRFRWQPCEKWEDCNWCGIDAYLTKEELREQFPDHAEDIPLGYTQDGKQYDVADEAKKDCALVIEIFDKKRRKVCVIAPGYDQVLEQEDDPWQLENFYPVVPPLFATTTSDKLIPIADYKYYQDQAIELDIVTNRIHSLVDHMRYRGVYDSSVQGLQDLANADDGEFIPIDNYLKRFGVSGGLESAMAHMPIEDLSRVLLSLYDARDRLKQTIYEITGIADIMRGATKASETLGAQQLKTQFGSMRLETRQEKVKAFMRALTRMISEMMVEHFEPETLSMITGKEIGEEEMEVMKNDLLRCYRVDIETDSTIAGDQAQERQDRIELLTAVTGFLEKIFPMIEMGLPMEVAKELLMFGVRSFKDGRQIEDALNAVGMGDGSSAAPPGMEAPQHGVVAPDGAPPQEIAAPPLSGPVGVVQ